MKKVTRVKKATGREMKRRAMNLMSMAYDINTLTKHDVFLDYSPHVKWVTLRIFEDGWKEDAYQDPVSYTIALGGQLKYDQYDSAYHALSELMKGAKK